MKLTKQMVLKRTKQTRLEDVRTLNFWGSDLDDVEVVRELPGVQVLSLSVNALTTLRPFAACESLEELYLRKNELASLEEVELLAALPRLRILWLSDNPLAEGEGYRAHVLSCLPGLTKLDNANVTDEERAAGAAARRARDEEQKQRRRRQVEQQAPQQPVANGEQSSGPQHSMVVAVLALLEELDAQHLGWVRAEADRRIRAKQGRAAQQ